MSGATDDGLAVVDDGLDRADNDGEENYLAEVLRLKGELLEQQGAPAAHSADAYDRAIGVARRQGAGLFERWAIERHLALGGTNDADLTARLLELPT